MKYWLLALGLTGPLAATAAQAGPQPTGSFTAADPAPPHRPTLDFRLVADRDFDPGPVHNSGMIAQTDVAPNATLGFGLLRASPRKPGTGEWRLDNGPPSSRKAAVTFRLKFR